MSLSYAVIKYNDFSGSSYWWILKLIMNHSICYKVKYLTFQYARHVLQSTVIYYAIAIFSDDDSDFYVFFTYGVIKTSNVSARTISVKSVASDQTMKVHVLLRLRKIATKKWFRFSRHFNLKLEEEKF